MNKDTKESVAVGIDLGGTNLRVGVVNHQGIIINSVKTPTLAHEGKNKVIDRIADLLEEILETSKISSKEIRGICIGAPGFLDIRRGLIRESPNLPGWKDVALKDEITKRTSLTSVFLQNDANVYTFGEWWKGAGNGYKSIVGITLGTGVGGGLILDKKIWSGEDGMAGEIGHMIVEPSGLRCKCGRNGCLESYSSGTAIVRRTIMVLKRGEDSSLKERIKGDFNVITPKMVFEEAQGGDCLSLDMLTEAGRYLGIAISSLMNILDIKRFVIGGRVAGAGDIILQPAMQEVRKRAINVPEEEKLIVQATLGDDAGIIGAAGVVLEGEK